MKTQYINPETVIAIAKTIGECDFRTLVSKYTTSDSDHSPWVITVGESTWQRHLVVENLGERGGIMDATLALLTTSESERFGYQIRTNNVQRRISLKELVSGRYLGVKRVLYPSNRVQK